MDNLFIGCAVIGGTLVVCQFLMTMVGLGGHGDVHTGDVHLGDLHTGDVHAGDSHDGSAHNNEARGSATASQAAQAGPSAADWLFSLLSFRTVVAAIAFFGLTGLAMHKGGADMTTTLAVAVAAGFAALYIVHALMRGLESLDSDGTLRIERAVGLPATVLLSIPGHNSGTGKIQMKLQNRLAEFEAVTDDNPLPGGAPVKVVRIVGPCTVAVAAAL